MSAWNGLGIGIGIPTSTWSEYVTNYASYRDWLRKVVPAFPKVRIIADYTSANSIAASRRLVQEIHSISPSTFILYGISGSNSLTSSNYDAYVTAVVAEATWAEANGITHFQVGNEWENRHDGSLTDQNIRDNMKTLCTSVKAVFTGTVSYAVAQGKEDGWITDGLGTLDKLSFNLYGNLTEATTLSVFKGYCDEIFAAFGTNCFISEWNSSYDWDSFTIKGLAYNKTGFDKFHGDDTITRLRIIQNSGIEEAYFFHAWSFSTDFGVNYFALLLTDGGLRSAYHRLLGTRPTHFIYGG